MNGVKINSAGQVFARLNKKSIVEAGVIIVLFLTLSAGRIAEMQGLGYALLLAICVSGGGVVASSIIFAVTGSLVGFSLAAVVISFSLSAISILVHIILKHVKCHRYIKIGINYAAGLPVYGVLLWAFGTSPLTAILSVLAAIVASALFAFAMPVLGGSRTLKTLPSAGIAALCFAFFVGLACINTGVFSLPLFAFALFALVLGGAFGAFPACSAGVLAGLAMSVATGDITYLAIYSASGALAAGFTRGFRVLSCIALIFGYYMCVFYFTVHHQTAAWALIPLALSSVIYIAVPKSWLTFVRDYFWPNGALSVMEMSSAVGRVLPDRIRLLSDAFSDMGGYLSEAGLNASDGKEAVIISGKLRRYCESCPRSSGCALEGDLKGARYSTKNKSGLREAVVASGCVYGGQLLKTANETIGKMDAEGVMATAEKRAMNSYGNRLITLSRMLLNMSRSIADEYSYDSAVSARTRGDLIECGITVSEVFVTPMHRGTAIVTGSTELSKLDAALSKCLKSPIRSTSVQEFERGWKAVRFERAPLFDVVYGFSGVAKDGASGDAYSVTNIGTRVMLSLCDGRGTGENAARLSSATLAVIEDYYKAGFDAVETVSCVNSLLAASVGEDFSALDVVSIDLTNLQTDIIKAGSPSTYIVQKENLLRIDGSALPVGALEAAKPALSRQVLFSGDAIVLVSDGISDSLPNLAEILSGSQTYNVQKLADDLVNMARSTSARDDMSALVARLIKKTDSLRCP